jgi:hypothetical protein
MIPQRPNGTIILAKGKLAHPSLLRTFDFSPISTYNSYLPSIFGTNALIWGYFWNISKIHFWGHWGQRTIDVEFFRVLIHLSFFTVGFWCQTIHKKFLQRFDSIFGLNMMMKSGLEKNILKFHDGLQSCCCPVPKNLPRKAELAWQVSRYLWRPLEFQNNFF